MSISLSSDQARLLRLRAQRLLQPSDSATVADVVREMGGIQAQETQAAALAIGARGNGLVATDVEQARVQEKSVVRTWAMRGTLHLITSDDLNWLLPVLGPVFIASNRRRRAELGLDEDTCVRGIHIIREALASRGALTRAEIVEQLATHGMRIEGQARPHLLARAALEGVICFGPDHGNEPTYVLLSDWIDNGRRGHTLSEVEAYRELTRRYLHAYAPATPQDQAAWSGLPISNIRAAWQDIAEQLIEVKVADASAWILKTQAAWLAEPPAQGPVVRLLPAFDNYLLGYHKRDLAVSPQYARRINAGGGMIHPVLLVDGRIPGTWKSKRQKDHLDVIVEPFDQLPLEAQTKLEAEVSDIARFLDIHVVLHMVLNG